MALREPQRGPQPTDASAGITDVASTREPLARFGGGVVPPLLHDGTSAGGQRTASEVAYASPDDPAPVPLPGQMITATVYDAERRFITSRTEPLYDPINADIFFGEVQGSSINWNDGDTVIEVHVRLGVQLDKQGQPTGGTPIEKWVRTAGKGRARYVLVEVEDATLKERDESPRPVGDETKSKEKPAVASGGTGTEATVGAGAGTTGTDATDQVGGASKTAHTGTRAEGTPRGGKARGDDGYAEGNSGPWPYVGGTRGVPDGTNLQAGYFYDPDLAKPGGTPGAPAADIEAGGMVGGTATEKQDGVPNGGWFEVISVPRNIAPAVAAGLILMDADIAGLGEDAVKVSMKLGKKAAGKTGALAKTLASKIERYADGEAARLMEALGRDANFMSKTSAEQAAIIAEARAGIVEETNRRVAAELDKRVAEGEKWAERDAKRTDEYADQSLADDHNYSEAAQRAKEALPESASQTTVEPGDVVRDGTARPPKADPSVKTAKDAWMTVPSALRGDVSTVLDDVKAAIAGDAAAQGRLQARHSHVLTGDLNGWTSVDIAGRQNPMRFLYKVDGNGNIDWMVKDTHQ